MAFDAAARSALIAWYERAARPLPWRATRDPYRILVSEIMLQQTQAERVVPKYHEFLERFPTLQALADAPPGEVIRAWAGLGYNRRALNLQRACRAVVERHGGVMPRTVAELAALPGVGPYTAGAIACFAFEQNVGFVDTNIRRVLHRVTAGSEIPQPRLSEREIRDLASALVPAGDGYRWNQALMELGATLCRARSAACLVCPVRQWCTAAPAMQFALASLPSRSGSGSEPFERTTRYARGRIVDALRGAGSSGLTTRQLAEALWRPEDTESDPRLPSLLAGLSRDGLIERIEPASQAVAEDSIPYDAAPEACDDLRYRLPD